MLDVFQQGVKKIWSLNRVQPLSRYGIHFSIISNLKNS